jgi:DNA gyrase/topoisomerase IV subunit B
MVKSEKTIEEKYQKLTQREHVLKKSGMYIGSISKQTEELWVFDENQNKMVKKFVDYSPGFMKIFDEVLTNATDHATRDLTVTTLKIDYSKETGEISVWNNGTGVPVVEHKEHKLYVPELIFGHLLSGSNYDDTQQRTVAGTNGLGVKICNIFSKKFIVETIDSDNKKKFIQEFSNNMQDRSKPKITTNSGKSYTKISFVTDFERFEMDGLEDNTILLINKRVYDCIACTRPTIQIFLNGERIKGKSFTDYCRYFFDDSKVISEQSIQTIKGTEFIWEYAVVPHHQFEQVSFVNGNATNQGGKHVDYILYQIINRLKEMLETKKKLKDVKPSFIKDRLFFFLRATVVNPSFNSQTKETLTTSSKDFGCKIDVSDSFLNKIYKSSIIEEIVEFCKLKESAKLSKETDGKKVNKIYIPKLEDAIWAGTNKSKECTLILTEGDSAKTFAMWGRSVVGPEKYGVMSLKGKLLNVRDASISQLINNDELNNIKQIMGLKQDKVYKDTSDLRYGKIMILTDADSVVGDTPLLLKDNENNIIIETIERLTSNFVKNELNNKEYGNCDFEVWTEKGWTKINSVMRHRVSKNIYRVLTHTGIVDVTEDHSLLNENSIEIAPKECNIGDKLLHSFPILNENKVDLPDNLDDICIRDLWKLSSKCKIPYYQSYKKLELINQLNIYKNLPIIELNNYNNFVNYNEAYVMGLFWADGTAGIYEWTANYKRKDRPKSYNFNRKSYNWSISNNNKSFLDKAKMILENIYNLEFKIIECTTLPSNSDFIRNTTSKIKKSFKLIINGGILTKNMIEKYINLFYYKNNHKYKNGNKYIPKEILNASKIIREQFLIGYYNGDGYGHDIHKQKELRFDVESKISAQCLFTLCKGLGYEVSINVLENKPNVISLTLTKGHQQFDKSKIKKIINLGKTEQYVYDLETENHHFQAGVGQMIVHNTDGSHIKSLFVNFIHAQWPNLLKLDFIQTVRTPIVKAIKGKKVIEFFTEQDYLKWKETNPNTNGYQIRYFKGLGTSKKEDAQDTFRRIDELKMDYYYKDKSCDDAIILAFEKDKNIKTKVSIDDTDSQMSGGSNKDQGPIKCTDRRKAWLAQYDKNVYIDVNQTNVPYQDLINKELIHFSIYDNKRSIPSICDGLKPSQRKILYYMLKKNITKVIKVAQLSGYVSAETGYHHGEASLQQAIICMAQNFVGTNNINLLYPDGNHGSRLLMGKDAASPRYIYTKLSDITQLIFNPKDTNLLQFLDDDGVSIEPEWYLPIIPMILVNGCEGIGTGYSTYIPPFNPKDIITNLLRVLEDKDPIKMMPYFRNFKGDLVEDEEKKGTYITKGKYEVVSDSQVKITELPIGMGVTTYKEFLESLIEGNTSKKEIKSKTIKKKNIVLKDVKNKTKDENDGIHFLIEFKNSEDLDSFIKTNTLEKELKLTKSINTNNMHVFSDELILTKYLDPNDILLDYYDLRLDYYQRRKDYLLKKLRRELKILENKMRFINEYISGDLDINRKSKDYILKLLKERDYTPFGNEIDEENVENGKGTEPSYDYLTRMPIISMTKEKIEELETSCKNKKKEVKDLLSKTNKDLWKDDLNELLAKL